jgi:hypothetical protein
LSVINFKMEIPIQFEMSNEGRLIPIGPVEDTSIARVAFRRFIKKLLEHPEEVTKKIVEKMEGHSPAIVTIVIPIKGMLRSFSSNVGHIWDLLEKNGSQGNHGASQAMMFLVGAFQEYPKFLDLFRHGKFYLTKDFFIGGLGRFAFKVFYPKGSLYLKLLLENFDEVKSKLANCICLEIIEIDEQFFEMLEADGKTVVDGIIIDECLSIYREFSEKIK